MSPEQFVLASMIGMVVLFGVIAIVDTLAVREIKRTAYYPPALMEQDPEVVERRMP